MEIPFSRWYPAIDKRRSRRQFDPRPVESELLAQLSTVCAEFKPFPHARTVLVTDSPDRVFKGIIGHYGKIKGAVHLLGGRVLPSRISRLACRNQPE